MKILVYLLPLSFFLTGVSHCLPLGFAPEEILAIIILCSLLCRTLLTGKVLVIRNLPIILLFGISLLFIFLGLLNSSTFTLASLKPAFGRFAIRAVIVYIVLVTLTTYKNVTHFVNTHIALYILLVGTGVGILLLTNFDVNFFRNTIYAKETMLTNFARLTAMRNPNFYARSLVLVMPLVIVTSLHKKRPLLKFALNIAIISGFLLITLTKSRMGLIGLVIEGVYLLFVFRKKIFRRRLIAITILCLLVISFIFAPKILSRFSGKLQQLEHYGTTIRIALHKSGLTALSERPFFGFGPGNGKQVVNSQLPMERYKELRGWGERVYALHSNYLILLVESGIIGFCCFLVFLAALFGYIRIMKSRFDPDSYSYYITTATQTSLLGWLVMGFSAGTFGMNLAWLILTIPFLLSRIATKPKKFISRRNEII